MPTIQPSVFNQRQSVSMETDKIRLTIVCGGGHIAELYHKETGINPLWEPTWKTLDPALRELTDPAIYGDSDESKVLSSITGHNYCLDVFGAHSKGEEVLGLYIHGETLAVAWEVSDSKVDGDTAELTMKATLHHTAMEVERVYGMVEGSPVVKVTTRTKNLVGFQRAMGHAEHATLGAAFLEDGPVNFQCNADKGLTFPTEIKNLPQTFKINAEFDYPDIPLQVGGTDDWREYPRVKSNTDLASLRMNPSEAPSWFTAVNPRKNLLVAYAWERDRYPWLVTWEESYARDMQPWNKKELTRGLEFSSYVFPSGRKYCVEAGSVFDTPAFEWIDAYEEKTSVFYMMVDAVDEEVKEAPSLAINTDTRKISLAALGLQYCTP